MNRQFGLILIKLSIFILLLNVTSCVKIDDEFSEVVKVVLRDAGNRLLISNQDSTSLILPITKIAKNKYQIRFENELSIDPDSLVSMMKSSLRKAALSNHYRVEVRNCETSEVSYSYEMNDAVDMGEIPCGGRVLPSGCYLIQVRFLEDPDFVSITYLVLLAIVIISFGFAFRKKENEERIENAEVLKIGAYEFYQDQNKLVFNREEVSLTNKECELLDILREHLNDVVKRDELMKRVWEDHGVFVGRSLDTYISKLRKKLIKDPNIKISNVHGVGYKLEVL